MIHSLPRWGKGGIRRKSRVPRIYIYMYIFHCLKKMYRLVPDINYCDDYCGLWYHGWATVDRSWHKQWNYARKIISTNKTKEKKSAGWEWMVEHPPKILASEEKASTTYYFITEELHRYTCAQTDWRPTCQYIGDVLTQYDSPQQLRPKHFVQLHIS